MHPTPFSFIPGGSLAYPGFPRSSNKARLTSAGAQETFNLASFLELSRRKWSYSKDQGEAKRPPSFRKRHLRSQTHHERNQSKFLWFRISRKSFSMIEKLCATHMLSFMYVIVWFTLCTLSQVTTLQCTSSQCFLNSNFTFELLTFPTTTTVQNN